MDVKRLKLETALWQAEASSLIVIIEAEACLPLKTWPWALGKGDLVSEASNEKSTETVCLKLPRGMDIKTAPFLRPSSSSIWEPQEQETQPLVCLREHAHNSLFPLPFGQMALFCASTSIHHFPCLCFCSSFTGQDLEKMIFFARERIYFYGNVTLVVFGCKLAFKAKGSKTTCGKNILFGIKWALEERCVETNVCVQVKNKRLSRPGDPSFLMYVSSQ